MKPGRTPCINPRCKRTADAEKFPDEMICAKCFRALPADLRQSHRLYWKRYNLYCRKITRAADPLKVPRLRDIRDLWAFKIEQNWLAIKAYVTEPEKREGLENFLSDMGMQ